MSVYYADDWVTLHLGDALEVARELPDGAADCIVTSPPYFGLRDYGIEGQYGLESSPAEYVETMRALFSELRRVLDADGTLWLNLGDSYSTRGGQLASGKTGRDYGGAYEDLRSRAPGTNGLPDKNLLGIPWRVAFALQDDGWILRNAIIWSKPNAMPESVTDRLSGRYEHVFLFSKSRRYWFDLDPIREAAATADRTGSRASYHPPVSGNDPQWTRATSGLRSAGLPMSDTGRNPGDVWSINTQPFSAAHFAVMPQQLAQRCILAGCKPGGTVLDPFSGSGTTGLAAQRTGRKYVGIDLNAEYLDLSLRTRLNQSALDFGEPA
jgi:DNA modification methylase